MIDWLTSVETCISDIKNWMIENKLQMIDDKMECVLMRPINAHKLLTALLFQSDIMSYSLLLHKT